MKDKSNLTKKFIEKAKSVHNNRYDYSKTVVIPGVKTVTITCHKHGDFEQDKYSHLQGFNCSECRRERMSFTKEEFIERAREIHGDLYDYSEVVYVKSNIDVKIFCKVHGFFYQKPKTHMKGSKCPSCSSTAVHTKDFFIEKARKVHGTYYDYSKVDYKNSFKLVTITCPEHGDFEQTPAAHLVGQGCRICGNLAKTLKPSEFIERSKKAHNDKYDYSKSVYINTTTKVKIICPKHGEFEQTPASHMNGYGCYQCKIESRRKTREEFIRDSNKKHNNKYDYSKTNFINTRGHVTIVCPIHGEFIQKANNHLNGLGCPDCSKKPKKVFNTKQFIKEAIKVHGNLYDYSEVKYVKSSIRVSIICKKHGKFEQLPANHLNGNGCPVCSESRGERMIRTILNRNDTVHVRQYTIPEVLDKYYYDFYLPEYKLLIEFHGQQHFEYTPFFHRNGEDDFLKQKNRDDIVRSNARLFKYRYLEFDYKQLDTMSNEEFEEFVMKKIKRFRKVDESAFKRHSEKTFDNMLSQPNQTDENEETGN